MTVRPIEPEDAKGLVDFHEALSPESQRLRFFGFHPHLTVKEVARFTTLDHRNREAFVVVAGTEIWGVGRYDRLDDPTEAEVAFVTRDDHQGCGVATLLFHELAADDGVVKITMSLTNGQSRPKRLSRPRSPGDDPSGV